MRSVIQRVISASVTVDTAVCGTIERGLLVFAGVEAGDTVADVEWMAGKIVRLRCFEDTDGKMNLSLLETGGGVLLISQFTLFGTVRKGTRPSFNRSAAPVEAVPLYEALKARLAQLLGRQVPSGVFAADMTIKAVHDGPVTLIVDSRRKDF